MNVDLQVENHGSLMLLRPMTATGETWISEHIEEDAPYIGKAVAVEPRYIEPIVEGARGDGLVVE